MRHHAILFFPFSTDAASAIAGALAPESTRSEVPKTRGEVERTPDGVKVTLRADDLASLRATVNSHLRWVDAAQKAAALGRRGAP